jgi:hypothetical protein
MRDESGMLGADAVCVLETDGGRRKVAMSVRTAKRIVMYKPCQTPKNSARIYIIRSANTKKFPEPKLGEFEEEGKKRKLVVYCSTSSTFTTKKM